MNEPFVCVCFKNDLTWFLNVSLSLSNLVLPREGCGDWYMQLFYFMCSSRYNHLISIICILGIYLPTYVFENLKNEHENFCAGFLYLRMTRLSSAKFLWV